MEVNRFNLNNLKTSLKGRAAYILKVYESIEEDYHYDAFISMCDNYLEYCKFWQEKFKPKWYDFLNVNKKKIYNDYCFYAQNTLSEIQCLINAYNSTIQEIAEEEEFIEATRKKLTIEHMINQELQDAQYEKLRKEYRGNKIGFVMSAPKKKRKYNKKKIDE